MLPSPTTPVLPPTLEHPISFGTLQKPNNSPLVLQDERNCFHIIFLFHFLYIKQHQNPKTQLLGITEAKKTTIPPAPVLHIGFSFAAGGLDLYFIPYVGPFLTMLTQGHHQPSEQGHPPNSDMLRASRSCSPGHTIALRQPPTGGRGWSSPAGF